MRLRALAATVLSDVKVLQAPAEQGAEQQAEQERGETGVGRPRGHILEDVEDSQRRPIRAQLIEELIKQVVKHYPSLLEKTECNAFSTCSSFTPRDPFTRTTSPLRTTPVRSFPASAASSANFSCSSLSPASREPARMDCSSTCSLTIHTTPATACTC